MSWLSPRFYRGWEMNYTQVLEMLPEDIIDTVGNFVIIRLGGRLIVVQNSSGSYTLILNASIGGTANGSVAEFSINASNFLLITFTDTTVKILQETS